MSRFCIFTGKHRTHGGIKLTKIVAFVPAKGSSERIQNKNLSVLDGEHLFKRKLRQLLECKLIDEVYLDTDSDEIAELASDLPVKRLKRPAALASNATDGHELFAWECAQVSADYYVQTLCTAPFVGAETLERALSCLLSSESNDSLIAVTKSKQYLWEGGEPLYGRGRIPNSVDLPVTTIEAMSLYAVRRDVLATGKRFGTSPILFELTPTENIDVNWPEDLVLAETIAAGYRAQENLRLAALMPYLNSALLSDITREIGIPDCTLPREIAGYRRFFGRAKTLLLDRCQPGEPWQGIYDALDSYQFVRPGDVIMVENRVKERAYFGNLNAQLAMRSGAVGAVVDGVTRDKDDVSKLGFSVFARGYYCADIKFEGTLRAMNKPILIGKTPVTNGDYVFADSDGVVVVPEQRWAEIHQMALKAIEKEFKVGMSVAMGVPPKQIFDALGEF
jgi:regulator of RNase E activity RraA/CMP-N-acetylneuraminic acid synthetase